MADEVIKHIAIIKAGVVIDVSVVLELDEPTIAVLNAQFDNPDNLIEIPNNILWAVKLGTLWSSGLFTPLDAPGDPSAWAWDHELGRWIITVLKPELSDPNNVLKWDNDSSTWIEVEPS
jgi:hypothetical protein